MSELLLIPGLISLYLVLRGRIDTAFLSVYLPCVLSLPDDYRLRIPHLPPTSVAEFALIPLGVFGLYRLIRSGSFSLMDILVPLYTASVGLSEVLHTPVRNDGIFFAMNATISIFFAYLAGRTLIEPNLRVATVRRFVMLILFDGIPGIYEWRMGQNLYGLFGQKFLGLESITARVQLRGGFGRMGSVFAGGNAELGGIAFAMTSCLNAWLVYLRRVKASVDLGEMTTKLEKYHVPGLVLLVYLLMTQSRGPMIALGAGYLILQIPRFKSTKMITVVVALLFVGGYLALSAFFTAYSTVTDTSAMTEQQSSAAYRRAMNDLYPPIAEKGGWTGYGIAGIPHIGGMESIDNHYLLVHLAWGRLSYILFILIVWNNIRILLIRSWQLDNAQDRAFIFSMLAAMAVLWITLLTVFLGGQLPQIAFLLMGWIESTGKPRKAVFSFRRVFT